MQKRNKNDLIIDKNKTIVYSGQLILSHLIIVNLIQELN